MTRAARAVQPSQPSPATKPLAPATVRAHLKALASSVGAGEKITATLELAPAAEKDHGEPQRERSPA